MAGQSNDNFINDAPAKAQRTTHSKKQTRKEQLISFLKENGLKNWTELLLETGIPKGTLSALLGTYKNDFHQDKDGKWSTIS